MRTGDIPYHYRGRMTRRLVNLLTILTPLLSVAVALSCSTKEAAVRSGSSNDPIRTEAIAQYPPRLRIELGSSTEDDPYHAGFIEPSGKIVIPPRFAEADGFSEGLAHVWIRGRQAYIDTSGNVQFYLPFDCAYAGFFSEGLALVNLGGKPEFHYIRGGRWGYVDRAGRLAVPATFAMPLASIDWYRGLGDFSEGLAAMPDAKGDTSGNYGYIDRTGRWVIEPRYGRVGRFSNGLAKVEVLRDKSRGPEASAWGYIDRAGKALWWMNDEVPPFIPNTPLRHNPPRFMIARRPAGQQEGNARYGFIDNSGNVVITPAFDAADEFSEGLAHVRSVALRCSLRMTHAQPPDGPVVAAGCRVKREDVKHEVGGSSRFTCSCFTFGSGSSLRSEPGVGAGANAGRRYYCHTDFLKSSSAAFSCFSKSSVSSFLSPSPCRRLAARWST